MTEKSKALRDQFERALKRLGEAMKAPKNEFVRDSAIQRFEFTFETVWKFLKSQVEELDPGVKIRHPGECFREAFKKGLIDNDPRWIQSIDERNKTSHTYNEDKAEEVYGDLPGFVALYEGLLTHLKKEDTEKEK